MSDVETVTVTVKIPAQEYTFVYEKRWYEAAVRTDTLAHFMDVDLSSIQPDVVFFGPYVDPI